jgi:hypothetical protein
MTNIYRILIVSLLVSGCQGLSDFSNHMQCAEMSKFRLSSNPENDEKYVKLCKACMATGKTVEQCNNEIP